MKLNNYNILLFALGFYVLAQIIWWGFIILDLQTQVYEPGVGSYKTLMILGEGAVFVALLIFGFVRLQSLQNKELELAQQQQNFVLSITHELKTPLTALKLSLQTLKQTSHSENEELLNLALKEERRLESFVEDLLAAKSLDKKEWEAFVEKVHLNDVINQIVEDLKPSYPKQQVKFSSNSPIHIYTDKIAVRIILLNLIDNALKYSPNNSEIIVKCKQEGNKVDVSVFDEADIIPVLERNKIFKQFYRSKAKSKQVKGNGLGLYLVKKFAQAISSKITVKSHSKGNVFSVEISDLS